MKVEYCDQRDREDRHDNEHGKQRPDEESGLTDEAAKVFDGGVQPEPEDGERDAHLDGDQYERFHRRRPPLTRRPRNNPAIGDPHPNACR